MEASREIRNIFNTLASFVVRVSCSLLLTMSNRYDIMMLCLSCDNLIIFIESVKSILFPEQIM